MTHALDLFGEIPPAAKPVKGGYAGRPGEGPVGETCGSCRHSARVGHNTRCYWKCMHGRGKGVSRCASSDIRKGAPACQFWEQETDD